MSQPGRLMARNADVAGGTFCIWDRRGPLMAGKSEAKSGWRPASWRSWGQVADVRSKAIPCGKLAPTAAAGCFHHLAVAEDIRTVTPVAVDAIPAQQQVLQRGRNAGRAGFSFVTVNDDLYISFGIPLDEIEDGIGVFQRHGTAIGIVDVGEMQVQDP